MELTTLGSGVERRYLRHRVDRTDMVNRQPSGAAFPELLYLLSV